MMLFSQGIFITIIDFVTWPPFVPSLLICKGGQVTKSIIVVKIPCKGGQVTKSIIVAKIPCENNIIYILKNDKV